MDEAHSFNDATARRDGMEGITERNGLPPIICTAELIWWKDDGSTVTKEVPFVKLSEVRGEQFCAVTGRDLFSALDENAYYPFEIYWYHVRSGMRVCMPFYASTSIEVVLDNVWKDEDLMAMARSLCPELPAVRGTVNLIEKANHLGENGGEVDL
jgi:hypothetical protein